LTYLIPCRVLTTHTLPTAALLAPFPTLTRHFTPIFTAIKHSSLSGFDAALRSAEPFLVRRRVYLTLERARDIVVRNLFRKVFLAGGHDETTKARRTRVPLDQLVAGVKISEGKAVDKDEVECLLANMIYKVGDFSFLLRRQLTRQGLIKGYIARGPGILVLSKSLPFPGTKIPA
jgi:hypothetical protein